MKRDDGRTYEIDIQLNPDPPSTNNWEVIQIEISKTDPTHQLEIKNGVLKIFCERYTQYYQLEKIESYRLRNYTADRMVIEIVLSNCVLALIYPFPSTIFDDHIKLIKSNISWINF